MKNLELFQLNIFAAMMLIILYFVIRQKLSVPTYRRTILSHLTLLSVIGILMEPISWIVDGKQFYGSFAIEYASNFLLLVLAPTIAGFLMVYVDYYIFKDRKRIRKRFYYMYPALLTVILLVINIFYPLYFSVDTMTHYFSRGDYYWIQYVILVAFYIYFLVFIINQWRLIDVSAKFIFIVFFALPLLGMGVQLLYSKVFLSWTSIAFAIFLMYIFLESTSGAKDYLTGLYSRRSFEQYIDVLFENKEVFTVLYIDLNGFKAINDTFGHLAGDHVLKEFSIILFNVLKSNNMISRLGGDEFIAVIHEDNNVHKLISEIENQLAHAPNSQMNHLTFSYGFSKFNHEASIDDIYFVCDREMYHHKKAYHESLKQN